MPTRHLGEFIRAARVRAGLSAGDLATKIMRSPTWVYRLETGDRAEPQASDMNLLSAELNLSAWESRYMYLLAQVPPPPGGFGDPPMHEYLQRIDQPIAWISFDEPNRFNASYLRLFPNCDQHIDLLSWLFHDEASRRVLANWEEVVDWAVGTARAWWAEAHHDPGVSHAVESRLENPEFRLHWESQVIPLDPSGSVWKVIDGDNLLTIDMRVWRHPYRTGTMLAGFVTSSTSASGNTSTSSPPHCPYCHQPDAEPARRSASPQIRT